MASRTKAKVSEGFSLSARGLSSTASLQLLTQHHAKFEMLPLILAYVTSVSQDVVLINRRSGILKIDCREAEKQRGGISGVDY